jgi:hypothetical protein
MFQAWSYSPLGARRGHGVAAALHLDGVEEGAVRHVVVRVQLAADDVPGLEVHEPIRAGTDGLEVGGGLATARASKTCRGSSGITAVSDQNGVGRLKTNLTWWSPSLSAR